MILFYLLICQDLTEMNNKERKFNIRYIDDAGVFKCLWQMANEFKLLTTLYNDFIIHQDLSNCNTTNFTCNDNSITWSENNLFTSALTRNGVYIDGGWGMLIARGNFFSNSILFSS